MNQEPYQYDVAIVGMSGRFPGANSVQAYWDNLLNEVESIRFFSDEELASAGVPPEAIRNPRYVKAAPVLEDPSMFDATFFEYSPRDAALIDPQQRIFLECCWNALEDASQTPDGIDGRIGVYAGSAMNTYFLYAGLRSRFAEDYLPTLIASDKDFLSTRVSYKLNLTGPSLTIQTACSTSLVAIHTACQSLLNQECDMALAGGVAVRVPHHAGHLAEEGSVFSPDGHCRPFDSRANGTIFGSGAGVVVLKRAEDAIADRDHIWALIKGSAVNNDGASKSDYTAPSVVAQSAAIAEALASADIEADSIGYVEAHGTGTYLGDPIELAALTQAFRSQTDRRGFCRIGSVKSNIGHLDAAAGVAGLIKVALALKHQKIPATLHFASPNPQIDFENSPFVVNDRLTEWGAQQLPRRAAINSLGIGGTNAHLILEEAPPVPQSPPNQQSQLIILSAKSEEALQAGSKRLSNWAEKNTTTCLADAAFSLAVGRKAFHLRSFAVADKTTDLVTTTLAAAPTINDKPDVVFMFPGQGSQYARMGHQLDAQEPVFAKQMDHCAEILKQVADFDLRELLYGAAENADEQLLQTRFTQPALFAVEYSLAKLWQSWGISPIATVGHSVGEYVAACWAEVFTVEDALRLVSLRGRLIQELPPGDMLAVTLSAEQVEDQLPRELSIAAINSPETCVVSGPAEPIAAFNVEMEANGTTCRMLRTSHAFHSSMMEPVLTRFREELNSVQLRPAQCNVYSTVTGKLADPACLACPDHWVANVRDAVRFSDCANALLERFDGVFVEVGPGQALGGLLQQHAGRSTTTVVSSLPHPKAETPARKHILNSLGQVWQAGVDVDWKRFYAKEPRRRVPLPGYAFDRQSHWLGHAPSEDRGSADTTAVGSDAPQSSPQDWLYEPNWRPAPRGDSDPLPSGAWLLFSNASAAVERLRENLAAAGHTVVTVSAAKEFSRMNNNEYALRPGASEDYDTLFRDLSKSGNLPSNIVHGFGLGVPPSGDCEQSIGIYSLIGVAKAVGKHCPTREIRLCVATTGMHSIHGEDSRPELATILGPGKLFPIEYPQVRCWSVDFSKDDSVTPEITASQLANEFRGDEHGDANFKNEIAFAYRDGVRLQESIQVVEPPNNSDSLADWLDDDATYMIIGGLGGIGLALAAEISRHVNAKFALVGRSSLPPREHWESLLAASNGSSKSESSTRDKVRSILALESGGAKCLYLQADASDKAQMASVVLETKSQLGNISGVIHSAGLMDFAGPMQTRKTEDTERILSAKLHGVQILDELLHEEKLKWLVLCSSNTTSLYQHRIGEVAYIAANSFLDAYAPVARIRYPNRITQTINWDAWHEVGMTAVAQSRSSSALVRDVVMRKEDTLTVAEGATLFANALASRIPRVIVSKRDLHARMSDTQANKPDGNARLNGTTNEQLAKIWKDLLGTDSIKLEDDFFALGGTSLTAIQMNGRIREELGKQLPLASILEARTISNLTKLIDGDSTRSKRVSLVELQPKGHRPPLFLMHAAGGNVMFYRQLCERLGKDQPVFAFQSQALNGDFPLATTIEQMAEQYVKELREVVPVGPYVLGGYCMGGTIAYEVAQQLTTQGEHVPFVAMFETYNWAQMRPSTWSRKANFWMEKLKFLIKNWSKLPNTQRGVFWKEKTSVIRDRTSLWRGNRLPDSVANQPDNLLAELWRVNDLAAMNYRPQRFDGRIVHFRPSTSHSAYDGCEFDARDVQVLNLNCYPAAMMLEPYVGQLADQLLAAMHKVSIKPVGP